MVRKSGRVWGRFIERSPEARIEPLIVIYACMEAQFSFIRNYSWRERRRHYNGTPPPRFLSKCWLLSHAEFPWIPGTAGRLLFIEPVFAGTKS